METIHEYLITNKRIRIGESFIPIWVEYPAACRVSDFVWVFDTPSACGGVVYSSFIHHSSFVFAVRGFAVFDQIVVGGGEKDFHGVGSARG